MSKLKLFGERVALREVDETFDTNIAIPQSRNVEYQLGIVESIGDGKVRNSDRVMEFFVEPGDVLMYQMNAIQMVNALFVVDEKPYFVLYQGDMIARLKTTTVTLETFEILGPWVLVRPFAPKRDSGILIPDTVHGNLNELIHFKLVQKGQTAKIDAEVGQEVIIERTMVHEIKIGSEKFGFAQADRIYGVVDGEVEEVDTTQTIHLLGNIPV